MFRTLGSVFPQPSISSRHGGQMLDTGANGPSFPFSVKLLSPSKLFLKTTEIIKYCSLDYIPAFQI